MQSEMSSNDLKFILRQNTCPKQRKEYNENRNIRSLKLSEKKNICFRYGLCTQGIKNPLLEV